MTGRHHRYRVVLGRHCRIDCGSRRVRQIQSCPVRREREACPGPTDRIPLLKAVITLLILSMTTISSCSPIQNLIVAADSLFDTALKPIVKVDGYQRCRPLFYGTLDNLVIAVTATKARY
jgi:hypothetical protein